MATQDDKKFADDITFGVGQTVACTAIDLVGDPHIGGKVQDRLEPAHIGKEMHAYKAELLGDTSGLFIFLGIQKYLPGISRGLKRMLKPVLDPIYEKLSRKPVESWAERHNVELDSTAFRAKQEEWKDKQEYDVARAAILSSASVVTNVAVQRGMGNPRKLSTITIGKITGAAVTMGATLAVRALAPRKMHHIDKRINNHFAEPLVRNTQKLFGIQGVVAAEDEFDDTVPVKKAVLEKQVVQSHAQKLDSEKETPVLVR